MSRLLLIALLLAPLTGLADSIYRTTDAEGNVVFTDAPPANSTPADRVDIQQVNTVEPPQDLGLPPPKSAEEKAGIDSYNVTIISPENETSFPTGPGNFSVRVRVNPSLKKYEGLQLFMDGQPWGAVQRDTMWDLTNVFRGQHDLTVGVINNAGQTLAMSEPVRVFVHRPSKNFGNR